MNIPYIGITDFTSPDQVRRLLDVFDGNVWRASGRRLHVGVMMSYKTLNGIETKWSKAFPPKESIAEIFSVDGVMNCLHYADYEEINLRENLMRAICFGGPKMKALQLDMVWPNPWDITSALHATGATAEVILQVGANALDKANNSPAEVVARIRGYQDVIDHVLLDKSMGRGLGMDAKGLLPFAQAIRRAFPGLGIAVAGGLGPDSMHLVKPLLHQFPNVSIDAQSRLRPSGNALDPIDWSMAEIYVYEAFKIL